MPRELTLLRQHRETLALLHRTARSAGASPAAFPVPPNLTREKLGLVDRRDRDSPDSEGGGEGGEEQEQEQLFVADALARVSAAADALFKKYEVRAITRLCADSGEGTEGESERGRERRNASRSEANEDNILVL